MLCWWMELIVETPAAPHLFSINLEQFGSCAAELVSVHEKLASNSLRAVEYRIQLSYVASLG